MGHQASCGRDRRSRLSWDDDEGAPRGVLHLVLDTPMMMVVAFYESCPQDDCHPMELSDEGISLKMALDPGHLEEQMRSGYELMRTRLTNPPRQSPAYSLKPYISSISTSNSSSPIAASSSGSDSSA